MKDVLDFEIKNAPVGPTGLQYGALGGLGLIIVSLFSHLMGWTQADASFSFTSLLSMVLTYGIMFGALFLGVKHLKEKLQDGYISFGKAFKLGLLISLIMALFISIWMYVFLEFIDPNFLQNMIDVMEFQFEEQGLSDEEIETSMGIMGYMFNPLAFTIMSFFSQFITGLILSLIAAAILQRK